MGTELKEFMTFKLNQHLRLNGIEKPTKGEIADVVKANMKAWAMEAIAAGF